MRMKPTLSILSLSMILLISSSGCGTYLSGLNKGTLAFSDLSSIESPVTYLDQDSFRVQIKNISDGTLSEISLGGLTSPFSIDSHDCPSELKAQQSCEVSISFEPIGAGSFSGDLVVSFDGGAMSHRVYGQGSSLTLSLEAIYASNSNWNDYVKLDDAGQSRYEQDDVACDGTETDYYFEACIHGGEKRKVTISELSDCTGVRVEDELGVFNWRCVQLSSETTAVMTGVKDDKGLSDLVNADSWKTNRVNIYLNDNLIGQTPYSEWWTNTVTPAPSNPEGSGVETLNTASTIYTVSSDVVSDGYNIAASKIGFVTIDGATLTYSGDSVNCNSWDGTTTSPNTRELICTGSTDFLWIEGDFEMKSGVLEDAMVFADVSFSVVHNSSFSHFNNVFTAHSSSDSSYNYFSSIRTENTDDGNTFLRSFSYNNFYKIRMSNGLRGLYERNGNRNVFVNAVLNNLSGPGIYIAAGNSGYSTYSFFTIANSWEGLYLTNSGGSFGYTTLNQAMLVNNALGFHSDGAGYSSNFSQIVTSLNSTNVDIQNMDNGDFMHNFIIGAIGSSCSVAGSTDPGLTTDGNCDIQGASTATVRKSIDITNSLVGKVDSDDSANSSDTDGIGAIGSITDWLSFDSWYRAWGKDGSDFANSDHRGPCGNASEACRIWDFRLAAGDVNLLNRSYDGLNANEAFVAGSTCPEAANGNITVTDDMSRTFLANAMEIVRDDIGNENGLCESDEACIYAPNFGAYQGHGDYRSNGTCSFEDGTVSGVTLYAYPNNGV